MKENEYLKQRLDNQIDWYDQKSAIQKKWYYRSRSIVLICTAAIPVLSAIYGQKLFTVITTAVLAALANTCEGILVLTKWHEKWIGYRSNAESLKHEKYTYLTSSGVYSGLNADDKFHTLVERAEHIISSENTNWASLGKRKEDKR